MTDFDRYVELYSRDLWRFCLKLCADSRDAEDLYQDTWAKAIEKFKRFRQGTDFRKWLFTICVNSFKDSGKSKHNSTKLDFRDNDEKERFLLSVPADEQDIDSYIDLRRALLSLPKKYRVVIALFYFKDFSLKEISDILDIPVGTVNSRLSTAKKLLKRRLSHE